MDLLYRLFTRSVDRFKIRISAKRPVHAHAPYTWGMGHIMSEAFLDDPEKFYYRLDPATSVHVLNERSLEGRRLLELSFPSPMSTPWPW